MKARTFIPPAARMRVPLGEVPNCGPYYRSPALTGPNAITISGATALPTGEDRERYHSFASIVTPAAGTLNTVITSFTCPAGHVARNVGIICFYAGTGFVEGVAASLFFSIRLNKLQFVRDYSSIPNTLGGLATGPFPVPGGIQLFGGDLLEFLVSVPVGSTIGTGGSNRCHAHLVGYYSRIAV